MTPDHIRQRNYRARQALKLQRLEKMEAALLAIRDRLKDNDKPLAVELRGMAEKGMSDG